MEKSNKTKILVNVAIGFGIFATLCVTGLIIAGVVVFLSVSNPAHVKSVAATFMTIAEPLPKGFTYSSAYDVKGFPIVQFDDEVTQAFYSFTSSDDPMKKRGIDPAALRTEEKVSEVKQALVRASKDRLEPHITDQLSFGNETMYYSIGHSEILGPDLIVDNTFCGIAQSSKTGKYLFLWVQKQNQNSTIDISRIKKILSAIKSF